MSLRASAVVSLTDFSGLVGLWKVSYPVIESSKWVFVLRKLPSADCLRKTVPDPTTIAVQSLS